MIFNTNYGSNGMAGRAFSHAASGSTCSFPPYKEFIHPLFLLICLILSPVTYSYFISLLHSCFGHLIIIAYEDMVVLHKTL